MLTWCKKKNIKYIVGITRNKRLEYLLKPLVQVAKESFKEAGEKQKLFTEFLYAAKSWALVVQPIEIVIFFSRLHPCNNRKKEN